MFILEHVHFSIENMCINEQISDSQMNRFHMK